MRWQMAKATSVDVVDPEVKTLLDKLFAGSLTTQEDLRARLQHEYGFGVLLRNYLCPKCEKPLSFTWCFGVSCMGMYGGCGWKPPAAYDATGF